MMCTAERDGEVTTGIEQMLSRRRDLDFMDIGRTAGENAISMLGGKPAQTGELRVILRPEALFDLLQNTVVPGFFGPSIEQGESFYSKKTGKKVAASELTLVDDPTVTAGPSSYSFDEEGAGSRRVPLIEDGVMTGALYDNFAATMYGKAATASGMRYVRLDDSTSHRRPPTTGCRNLVIESETMPYSELVEETKRGIIVDYVMGSHTANRVSTDFSVAIYAGCYVEKGEIAYPLRGGMISGRAAVMLEDITLADDMKVLSGREGSGAYLPSVAVEGLNYSA
jgi:PmbA protein